MCEFDQNACLEQILQLTQKMIKEHPVIKRVEVCDLTRLIADLDEHLITGGELPKRWNFDTSYEGEIY